jgi:phenylalanyl-tRNA synthetase alpha chain
MDGMIFIFGGRMPEENSIQQEMESIQQAALSALQMAEEEASLQQWRIAYLGKSAPVMKVFSKIGQYAPEDRPKVGQAANQVKNALEEAFTQRQQVIQQAELMHTLQTDRLDVTLPGRIPMQGRYHVQTQTMREISRIFGEMGFQTFRARDVETDEFNFELLNIPAYHPARDMWDTYYTTKPGVILRTHTSPGQIHAMREHAPEPIRVILPGMCYRYEQMDARHEIQFTQVEVVAVDKGITFGDLKGTLDRFARRMFGENVRTRLRPSYFPFTEPSAELDIECFVCGGKGCGVCKGAGWLEILGCGMMHPTVLKNGGYDPRVYSGFAAGMGPERISMLRYKIDDIRYFWGNDIRFLEQF